MQVWRGDHVQVVGSVRRHLSYGLQQSLNRRVIACRRAFEKVGDLTLRHDNHGTTKLQGMPLKRTRQETCPQS